MLANLLIVTVLLAITILVSSIRVNSKAAFSSNYNKKLTQLKATSDAISGDNLNRILISSSNVTSIEEFLESFGIHDKLFYDPVSGRRKPKASKGGLLGQQATCEPEMRTVQLDESNKSDELLFPRCIRVPRCGGCCGLSDRMSCVPSKVSQREVRRARVRVKRSVRNGGLSRAEAAFLTTNVDVHEACRCECTVKESDCDPSKGQLFRGDLCACECQDRAGAATCAMSSLGKFWDPSDCSCKCRRQAACSTGLTFSHDSCSCEAFIWH